MTGIASCPDPFDAKKTRTCDGLKGENHDARQRRRLSPSEEARGREQALATPGSRLGIRLLVSIAVCAGAFATSGCRLMQSKAEVTPGDQQFMLTAAGLGAAEIGLGKPASDSGASADIRSFGQRMVPNILASPRNSRSLQTGEGFGF